MVRFTQDHQGLLVDGLGLSLAAVLGLAVAVRLEAIEFSCVQEFYFSALAEIRVVIHFIWLEFMKRLNLIRSQSWSCH